MFIIKKKLHDFKFEINSQVVDIVVGDLRSELVLDELYRASRRHSINVLVNNAAIPCYGLPLDGMKPMQVYESIETNLLSPIRLTQKIYPLLKEQRHGSIININSIVGKEPKKYRSVHSATKWGLKGFTKSLRIEAEDYNVKLINVYPSQIKTVKEHTFGLEPYDVAKQIYNEHQTGKDWDELIIDGRPEEFRP